MGSVRPDFRNFWSTATTACCKSYIWWLWHDRWVSSRFRAPVDAHLYFVRRDIWLESPGHDERVRCPQTHHWFGTTGTFGTSGFRSTTGTTTTSTFVQPSTTSTTGAFGNNDMFGNKPGFRISKYVSLGSLGRRFDAPMTGQFDSTGNITTGTSDLAYSAFNKKDTTNANPTLAYQSITCMSAHRGYTSEVSLIFPLRIASLRSLLRPSESPRCPHHLPTPLPPRRNSGYKTTNRIVRRLLREDLVPVRLT